MTVRIETRVIGNTEYIGAVHQSGIWTGECLIGVEEAKYLKAKLHENQRKLKTEKVAGIASDLEGDAFRLNGETIVIDKRGNVVDGMHRVEGILLSSMPMLTFVVIGVEPEVMSTLDTGSARNFADVLKVRGEHDPNLLGRLTKMAYLLDEHDTYVIKGSRNRPTHATLGTYFTAHKPEIIAAASVARTTRQRFSPVVTSAAGFAFYMFDRLTPPQAGHFMEMFATGVGDAARTDHPIYVLRDRLIRNTQRSVSEKSLTPDEMLALICRTWNTWRNDEKAAVQKVQVTSTGKLTSENFPVPR